MPNNQNQTQTQTLRWYDYEKAADYLGLSVRQIQRAQTSGKLGCTKLGGLRVYFSKEQLDAYIEACTIAPTAKPAS